MSSDVCSSDLYDGLDRMSVLYQGALGSTTNMVSYGYNNRGLRASQTGRYGQATAFGYDVAGRFNALSHNIAGTAQDVAYSYGFNPARSEEHTSKLQSLMRNSYAVFCLKKKKQDKQSIHQHKPTIRDDVHQP